MNKIKVGMILERDFPPDDRPEKEAISLVEQGFEVHMLSFTWQNKPLREIYKGIHLTRFKINQQVYKKLNPTYLALPFYRLIWRKHIKRFVKENEIDIIHIHDLPMTDIAHEIAAEHNCRVVCDQHEYWSNWIVNTAHLNTLPGKIVKTFSNWKRYEATNLKKADLVITVTEPLRDAYISDVKIDPKKIITVPNTPTRSIFINPKINTEIIERYKDNFVIFYAGVMDVLRGMDTIIDALPEIEKTIPNVKFVTAGRFAKGCNIMDMAKVRGIEHLVEFRGWLDVGDLPSYMHAADVCVFTPHPTRDEINNTIATKIFQYLAMQKPIITSQAKMMKDFVTKNEIGYAIDSAKPESFAECVKKIFTNYDSISQTVSKNCLRLLKEQDIFWDQTVKPMLKAYKRLEGYEGKTQ